MPYIFTHTSRSCIAIRASTLVIPLDSISLFSFRLVAVVMLGVAGDSSLGPASESGIREVHLAATSERGFEPERWMRFGRHCEGRVVIASEIDLVIPPLGFLGFPYQRSTLEIIRRKKEKWKRTSISAQASSTCQSILQRSYVSDPTHPCPNGHPCAFRDCLSFELSLLPCPPSPSHPRLSE